MSQKEWNSKKDNSIAMSDGKKTDRKSSDVIISGFAVAGIVVVLLFTVVGGAIYFGGLCSIVGICKSKLPPAAKIILSIVTGLVFLALLLGFILLSSVNLTD